MKKIYAILAALCAAMALNGCAHERMTDTGWDVLVERGAGMENFRKVGTANWRDQDDAIVADKGGAEPSYLVSRTSYTDFVLYAEFWVSDDANSGIYLRLSDLEKVSSKVGYEVNIFDKRPDAYGTGAIVNVAKVDPMPKAGGRWHSFEITAKGSDLTVKMDGVVTSRAQDRSFFHGPIALQYAGGVVKFRKVLVKPV